MLRRRQPKLAASWSHVATWSSPSNQHRTSSHKWVWHLLPGRCNCCLLIPTAAVKRNSNHRHFFTWCETPVSHNKGGAADSVELLTRYPGGWAVWTACSRCPCRSSARPAEGWESPRRDSAGWLWLPAPWLGSQDTLGWREELRDEQTNKKKGRIIDGMMKDNKHSEATFTSVPPGGRCAAEKMPSSPGFMLGD